MCLGRKGISYEGAVLRAKSKSFGRDLMGKVWVTERSQQGPSGSWVGKLWMTRGQGVWGRGL